MFSITVIFRSCFSVALLYGIYLIYTKNWGGSLGYFSLAFACLAISLTPSSLKVDIRDIVQIENRGWLVFTGISAALAFAAIVYRLI